MDALSKYTKYRESLALAESNYRTRLGEYKRLMGEARTIYEEDCHKALEEYQSPTNKGGEG